MGLGFWGGFRSIVGFRVRRSLRTVHASGLRAVYCLFWEYDLKALVGLTTSSSFGVGRRTSRILACWRVLGRQILWK